MQIQTNTDKNIEGGEALSRHVEETVENSLKRFADRITRVEVHLKDVNSSAKGGDDDKHCQMEARLTGMQPISVTAKAATVDEALDAAADKLENAVSRILDRQDDRKGRTSFSGD